MAYEKVAFVSSGSPKAQEAFKLLCKRYGGAQPEEADVIVALGGDGFMLETLHVYLDRQVPIYGMNRGTVGFLMNEYREEGLMEHLDKAAETVLNPLQMIAECADGTRVEALAINEVSLLRQTRQAAKIAISVDGKLRIPELICDGVLVATAAGSTAFTGTVKSMNGMGRMDTVSVRNTPDRVGTPTYTSPHNAPMKVPVLNTFQRHPSVFDEVSASAVAPPACT